MDNYLGCSHCKKIKNDKLVICSNENMPSNIIKTILDFDVHCQLCKKLLLNKVKKLYKYPSRNEITNNTWFIYGYKYNAPMKDFSKFNFYSEKFHELMKEIHDKGYTNKIINKHINYINSRLKYFEFSSGKFFQLLEVILSVVVSNKNFFDYDETKSYFDENKRISEIVKEKDLTKRIDKQLKTILNKFKKVIDGFITDE